MINFIIEIQFTIHICFNMFKTKNWNYKQGLNWLQNLKSKQVCTKTIKLVRQMSVSIDSMFTVHCMTTIPLKPKIIKPYSLSVSYLLFT